MKHARVLGGSLAYRVAGEGRPVVFLHGGALDQRMWDQQVEDLARDYQVIAFDARSHGQSSTATSPFRPCDDVAALVAHLGIPRATLVGLSMGGGTAVDTALEHPEIVEALVVCGAGTNEPTFADPWTLQQQQRMLRAQQERDPDAWVEAFLVAYLAGPHRRLDEVEPAIVERCREMALHTLRTHASRPDAVLPEHAARPWERLQEIRAPLLTVVGDLDSPDHLAMSERLATGVRGAQSSVIGGAAHYPNLERPEEFNQVLGDFLARLSPNSRRTEHTGAGHRDR